VAGRTALGALAVAALAACAGARGKANDSVATSASDSVGTGQPAAPAPAPAASTPAGSPTDSSKPGSASAAARAETIATAATPRAAPSETVLTGKVVAGGLAGAPETSLQIEGGKPTTLIGPLEPELRRLGGATVWVTGSPGSAAPNATFTVSRYEIVSIDGAKPLVGVVAVRDGATWLAAERDTVKLVEAAAELSAKVGAKAWVVGRRSGKDLVAQTYGIIREP